MQRLTTKITLRILHYTWPASMAMIKSWNTCCRYVYKHLSIVYSIVCAHSWKWNDSLVLILTFTTCNLQLDSLNIILQIVSLSVVFSF